MPESSYWGCLVPRQPEEARAWRSKFQGINGHHLSEFHAVYEYWSTNDNRCQLLLVKQCQPMLDVKMWCYWSTNVKHSNQCQPSRPKATGFQTCQAHLLDLVAAISSECRAKPKLNSDGADLISCEIFVRTSRGCSFWASNNSVDCWKWQGWEILGPPVVRWTIKWWISDRA